MSRRWRWPRPRRGTYLWSPPPSVQPVVRVGGRRRVAPVVRRGRFIALPLPQAVQAAPAFPPPFVRQRAKAGLRARRAVFLAVPVQSGAVPAAIARRSRPVPAARRGHYLQLPAGREVAPPAISCGRRRPGVVRRGRIWSPPWPQQAAPVPPAWAPPSITARRRRPPSLVRRSHFTALPLIGAAAPNAPLPDVSGTFAHTVRRSATVTVSGRTSAGLTHTGRLSSTISRG